MISSKRFLGKRVDLAQSVGARTAKQEVRVRRPLAAFLFCFIHAGLAFRKFSGNLTHAVKKYSLSQFAIIEFKMSEVFLLRTPSSRSLCPLSVDRSLSLPLALARRRERARDCDLLVPNKTCRTLLAVYATWHVASSAQTHFRRLRSISIERARKALSIYVYFVRVWNFLRIEKLVWRRAK